MKRVNALTVLLVPFLLISSPIGARSYGQEKEKPKDIYKHILAGTVWIVVVGPDDKPRWTGSGWIVDGSSRLIVTNEHVVEKEATVRVMFPRYRDGEVVAETRIYLTRLNKDAYTAKVIESDVLKDLALIQLEKPIPPEARELSLAAKSAAPGNAVHSVGSPGVSDALWVYTSGTVRQVYAKAWNDGTDYRKCRTLETQSPINRGDSGGPIVNDAGLVVAVVSATRNNANLVSTGIDVQEVKTFLKSSQRLLNPQTAMDYHFKGERLQLRAQYNDAIDAFTNAIRRKRDYADAYRDRALAFYRKGDIETAFVGIEDAIRLNSRDPQSFLYRAWLHEQDEEFDDAIADFSKVVEIDSSYFGAFNSRGNIYLNRNDLKRALGDFDQAVKVAPTHYYAYFRRGIVYYRKDELDKAISDCSRSIKLHPRYPFTWQLRGLCYQEKKDFNRALDDLVSAVKLARRNPVLRVNLGLILMDKREWAKALGQFEEAIKIDPGYARAYYVRGLLYEAREIIERAQADYEKALKLNSGYGKFVKRYDRCQIKITNNLEEPIKLHWQYEYKTKSGWAWWPAGPDKSKKSIQTDLKQGQQVVLEYEKKPIQCRKVFFWAVGKNSGTTYNFNRDAKDYRLLPDSGYLATNEPVVALRLE